MVLDFDVASNRHNALLEPEETSMSTTRRTFLGTTLVGASAVALYRFPYARSAARTATVKTKDGVELFVKDAGGGAPAVRSCSKGIPPLTLQPNRRDFFNNGPTIIDFRRNARGQIELLSLGASRVQNMIFVKQP
jgi:hypothetical protein